MKSSIFNAKYSIEINHLENRTKIKMRNSLINKPLIIKSTKYSEILKFIEDFNLLELDELEYIDLLDYYDE